MNPAPAIVVHGGAWKIPEEEHGPHVEGCRRAAIAGWEVLRAGGSAPDAVEAAVRLLEDDPTFDAGRGSCLDAVGEVERLVDLTGFVRPLAWLFWGASALGARISPLHGRFPIAIRPAALEEARTLTEERVRLI